MYLAAPLFSAAERQFNLQVRQVVSARFEVYLPQEDGLLLVDMVAKGASPATAGKKIFDTDLEAIRRSSFLLIVLDGRTIDEGACFELGYAHALGKRCFGLQTDPRRLLSCGNNPMIQNALERIFISLEQLDDWAKDPNETQHLPKISSGAT